MGSGVYILHYLQQFKTIWFTNASGDTALARLVFAWHNIQIQSRISAELCEVCANQTQLSFFSVAITEVKEAVDWDVSTVTQVHGYVDMFLFVPILDIFCQVVMGKKSWEGREILGVQITLRWSCAYYLYM